MIDDMVLLPVGGPLRYIGLRELSCLGLDSAAKKYFWEYRAWMPGKKLREDWDDGRQE
jgi:hypothetical protein